MYNFYFISLILGSKTRIFWYHATTTKKKKKLSISLLIHYDEELISKRKSDAS